MKYKINNGIYFLDKELSKLENKLFKEFELILDNNKFDYLSLPSTIQKSTYYKQDLNLNIIPFGYQDDNFLSGSAEQGFLEYFSNSTVNRQFLWSKNQCFRLEEKYYDLVRVKEFIKLEQFVFTNESNYKNDFDVVLGNVEQFLNNHFIQYRIVDLTKIDVGYHHKKYDVEVKTKNGWMETHSCSFFSNEQSKRYNIEGDNYTISCTGIASPRILIPFIERQKEI